MSENIHIRNGRGKRAWKCSLLTAVAILRQWGDQKKIKHMNEWKYNKKLNLYIYNRAVVWQRYYYDLHSRRSKWIIRFTTHNCRLHSMQSPFLMHFENIIHIQSGWTSCFIAAALKQHGEYICEFVCSDEGTGLEWWRIAFCSKSSSSLSKICMLIYAHPKVLQ